MRRTAKTYIYGIIVLGFCLLAWSVISAPLVEIWWEALFVALVVAASVVKLRLPGTQGTYSLSFLLLLYGVAHYSLAETLVAGCAGVIAQSFLNANQRPKSIQVLFNAANVSITLASCFAVGRYWLGSGIAHYQAAVVAVVACTYFVVNTVLVSGVLSLLENKPLADVCSHWYLWSFPCYLVGVTLIGLIPAQGHVVSAEAFLVLLPVTYLLHFFLGLTKARGASSHASESSESVLPFAAHVYIVGVLTGGVILLTLGGLYWESDNSVRFISCLTLAIVASTFKIKLPRMTGTITPAFILLLTTVVQMSFPETVFMAAIVGTVQLIWRPSRRPTMAQLLFNPACLVLSSALAWSLSRYLLAAWIGNSVVMTVVLSTVLLYGCNTLLVAAVVALAERKSLGGMWQLCYFWSLPFYLVGAAAAGIMTAISQSGNWAQSLLILPITGLAYLSYGLQIGQSVARPAQVEAA